MKREDIYKRQYELARVKLNENLFGQAKIATDSKKKPEEEETSQETSEPGMLSTVGHLALDVLGLVPVIGEPADLLNAAWYAKEGDYTNAALSAASAVPVAGYAATATKFGLKGADAAMTASKAANAADTAVGAARVADTATDAAKAAPAINAQGRAMAKQYADQLPTRRPVEIPTGTPNTGIVRPGTPNTGITPRSTDIVPRQIPDARRIPGSNRLPDEKISIPRQLGRAVGRIPKPIRTLGKYYAAHKVMDALEGDETPPPTAVRPEEPMQPIDVNKYKTGQFDIARPTAYTRSSFVDLTPDNPREQEEARRRRAGLESQPQSLATENYLQLPAGVPLGWLSGDDDDEDRKSKKGKNLEKLDLLKFKPGVFEVPDISKEFQYFSAFRDRESSSEMGKKRTRGISHYFKKPTLDIAQDYARSIESIRQGIPESTDMMSGKDYQLYSRVKSSVNRYLKSKEGRELDNHLKSIKKDLT